MLFRKKVEKSCEYCANGVKLNEDQVLCAKQGLVSSCERCRRFKYDPCKRIPRKAKPLDFKKYEEKDYSL